MVSKVLRLYLTNKEERVPRRPLGPFRTDAAIYKRPPATGLRVTWFGHSSLLIEIDGLRVLVDPVWDERASPVNFAGPKRFFDPTLGLTELPPLDVVLISHNHYDHLGKQTIRKLAPLTDARFVTSLGAGPLLQRFGAHPDRITEMDWTDSLQIKDLSITALPARHFSGRGISDRFDTLWSSFVLNGPEHKIYYGADSGLWPGFAEIGHEYGPFDLTMLEVGAYNELWKSIHMGPEGAAQAFSEMGASGLLMPIHWGLFDLALHAWYQPIKRIRDIAYPEQFKLWSPTPGVPTDVIRNQALQSNWWETSAGR